MCDKMIAGRDADHATTPAHPGARRVGWGATVAKRQKSASQAAVEWKGFAWRASDYSRHAFQRRVKRGRVVRCSCF